MSSQLFAQLVSQSLQMSKSHGNILTVIGRMASMVSLEERYKIVTNHLASHLILCTCVSSYCVDQFES